MLPVYEERDERLYLIKKVSRHVPPHLHHSMEMVYVTEGTLEFGAAQQLFHMEKGDFAIAFPEVIHHYQVFSEKRSGGIYLFAHPALAGPLQETLRSRCPADPVIKAKDLHPDVKNALTALGKEGDCGPVVAQSYVQLILARCLPLYELVDKDSVAGEDIVYRTVSFIAGHFQEELTLEKVATQLGVGKYALSRMFSATFHENFSQYVNEQRLNFAASLLECSQLPITRICYEAGFGSQRTFNRAFQEKFRMTPRQYRAAAERM